MPVAGPVERVFQMNIAMKASTATTAPTRSPRVAEFPPALVGVCCLRFFPLTCGDAATRSAGGQPTFLTQVKQLGVGSCLSPPGALRDFVCCMSRRDPHIEVELKLLPTEQGGRRAPIFSGFAGVFCCDGGECDSVYELHQTEFVFPGQRARAFITFRHPELQMGRPEPGKSFQLCQGRRVVGEGRVTRIVSQTSGLPTAD